MTDRPVPPIASSSLPRPGIPAAPPRLSQVTFPNPTAPAALPRDSTLPSPAPLQLQTPGNSSPTEDLPPPSAGIRQAPVRPLVPAPAPVPPPQLVSPPVVGKPAEYRRSPFRFLPLIIGGLLVVALVAFLFTRFFGNRGATTSRTPVKTPVAVAPVNIAYWGLWEPTKVLQEVLADFELQNPGIKVTYQQQTYRDYRERLQTAVASGKGPDVFRFHASWTPMLKAELDPVPSTVYSSAEFDNTFYPIAGQQLKVNNRLVGVPLMYEGLALFYNKEALDTANVKPPTTWSEMKATAPQLTIRTGGKIQRAGLAIGNAANVEHFSDILALLLYQNGADPEVPTSARAQDVMTFYTGFYTQERVWDESLPSSTVAFARGEVAMMFAPSWRALEVMNMNPNLAFGVAPVPQLAGNRITVASYWAEGVSAQSKKKDASWKLLKYLTSQDALRKLHSSASKERSFGEIYSRKDMATELAGNTYAAPFLSDAPYAQSWYLNSFTHDNGINDQIIKYYEDAVTGVATKGKAIPEAMSVVDQGIKQVLRQYNAQKAK